MASTVTSSGASQGGCTPLWIKAVKSSFEEGGGVTGIDSATISKGTNDNNGIGTYRVIQKLVTTSPHPKWEGEHSEIETALESFHSPNGECLWRRVAVRSGPTCPKKVIHASFTLPSNCSLPSASTLENNSNYSLLCWCAFPERPNHKLLCVLVSPSSLSIWDVYPTSDDVYVSGEGHSISLPFECCSIYPIGGKHGLLLQRKEDQEDKLAFESYNRWNNSMNGSNIEDDDGFFLKVPNNRHLVREPPSPGFGGAGSSARGSNTLNSPRMLHNMMMSNNSVAAVQPPPPVTSLFSLRHPLDDVLPISIIPNSDTAGDESHIPAVVTDVFEKVIFTGTIHWTNHTDEYLNKRQYEQSICVTYHTIRKRHAIWMLQEAPPPPPAPPLWQRTRQWRSRKNIDSHLGFLDLDAEDMELLGIVDPDKNSQTNFNTTRDQALADALGVTRRTPRKSNEPLPTTTNNSTLPPRGARTLEARSRRRDSAGTPTGRGGNNNNNNSFVNMNTTLGTAVTLKDAYSVDMDVSTDAHSTANATAGGGAVVGVGNSSMHLLNIGPLSNLHPNVAVTCLYEETGQSEQATNVFLASNLEGSGLLVLCLVRPTSHATTTSTNRRDNTTLSTCPNELNMFSFQVTILESENETEDPDRIGHSFSVVAHPSSHPCIAAQPVQATPVSPCFSPHMKNIKDNDTWNSLATDILILTKDIHGNDSLSLNRAYFSIADCAVDLSIVENGQKGSRFICKNIVYPVGDRVDFLYHDTAGKNEERVYSIRGKVSTIIESGYLTEKSLSAIDAAMFKKAVFESNWKFIEFALKFRTDCCRLEQAISMGNIYENDCIVEDKGWAAIETVFLAVLDFELFGESVNNIVEDEEQELSQKQPTDDSPFSKLLNSTYHLTYSLDNTDSLLLDLDDDEYYLQQRQKNTNNPIRDDMQIVRRILGSIHSHAVECLSDEVPVVSHIFDALHLLFEDLKLSCCTNKSSYLRSIGTALIRTCRAADLFVDDKNNNGTSPSAIFVDHYTRDLGETWVNKVTETRNCLVPKRTALPEQSGLVSSFAMPPCFFSWLDRITKREASGSIYDAGDLEMINAACTTSRSLLRIFSILFQTGGENTDFNNHNYPEEDRKYLVNLKRDHDVVSALIEEGFVNPAQVRDELPVGIAVPLLEVLHRCRGDPELANQLKWKSIELSLIGRKDLSENTATVEIESTETGQSQSSVSTGFNSENEENSSFFDCDKDGLAPLELTSAMLFPGDNRIREAGRLLRSSRPSFLSVPRAIEVSDHEYERLKQNKLLLLCRRSLALPVGRGMLTIGSFQPVAAEPLPLPNLCLIGRVPPTNATLALDISDCPQDMKVWPEFHNGVAAGLRLPLEGGTRATISKITRTWIVYNRPPASSPPPQQNNNNNTNNNNDSSSSTQSHAHGGLLMALGLRGHLTELEMTDVYDYLTQGSVTTTVGVLLGMAANKRGSCDISVSKMLCLHIPSLIPQHFSAIDVASPVQTAAVAGAGLLFQRSSHRMMTEFLLNEIGRRPDSDVSAFDREAYTLSCGIALGMVNLCQGEAVDGKGEGGGGEGLSDLRIGERLYRYIVGGVDEDEVHRIRETNDRLNLPMSSGSGESERCSCVFEGDSINTDVTAPGATLALGLIFMKSGNQTVASAIALPDTHFLLEYVRPDFLGLRVVSRALILWEEVQPTRQWIEEQLPLVVRKAYSQMRATVEKATDLGDMFGSDDVANLSSAQANETDAQASEKRPASNFKKSSHHTSRQHQDFDRQAIRQIHVHVISGACFGIGLRYAGTGNRKAAAAIFERVVELQQLRDGNDSVSVAMRPEIQILETCLGCAAVSLAMVLAGTGDIEALRLFKILRWRCDEQVKCGTHMAYATAIGLLYLGGGRCTLGREPEDIAALVAAFFPRYPSTTTDNQYHLQALRHLYALAVKQREIRFADIDTHKSVYVPIEVIFRDKKIKPLRLTAPCLLNNFDAEAVEIRVVSDRFYPVRLDLRKPIFGRTFFVKKKIASSSLIHDPRAQRSLSMQTGNLRGPAFLDQIKSFTRGMNILAFAQYICDDICLTRNKTSTGSPIAEFCLQMLYECLMNDTEEALTIYLALRSSISSIEACSSSAARVTWDFRLLRSYHEHQRHPQGANSNFRRLLNVETLTYLTEVIERLLNKFAPTKIVCNLDSSESDDKRVNKGAVLVYYCVPLSGAS